MSQTQALYLKAGIVGVVLIIASAFVLLGKMEAPAMLAAIVPLIGALVVALGLSGAGAAISVGQQNAARMAMAPGSRAMFPITLEPSPKIATSPDNVQRGAP
jgi:hypothetical protein